MSLLYMDQEDQRSSMINHTQSQTRFNVHKFRPGKRFICGVVILGTLLGLLGHQVVQRSDQLGLQRFEQEQVGFDTEFEDDITNLRRGGRGRSISGGGGGGDIRVGGFFIGGIMILCAIPMAWFNEKSCVKIGKLIQEG